MNSEKLEDILNLLARFAEADPEILAMALCGSWARGTARDDSDIDLSIIVKDKIRFKDIKWLKTIGFEKINDKLEHYIDKTYGRVWSRHVFLKSGTEIEFSFADESWADCENPDTGTVKVVSDGYRIMYDPFNILQRLIHKIGM